MICIFIIFVFFLSVVALIFVTTHKLSFAMRFIMDSMNEHFSVSGLRRVSRSFLLTGVSADVTTITHFLVYLLFQILIRDAS